ncbi:MAG: IS66 family transposase [Mycobacterium sp.]
MTGEGGEITALRAMIAEQAKVIEQLRSENEHLRRLLDEERRNGKRQAAPFSKGAPKVNPKKPGRKPGTKYGRQSRRAVPRKIDDHVVVECPLMCPYCDGEVKLNGEVGRQYQTDIPIIEPATTEFEIQYGRCTQCGRRVQGRVPEQTSNAAGDVGAVQIGPNAVALAAHLNKNCGMSYGRIAEIFALVFNLAVSRSTLTRALLRLARKAEPTFEDLIEQIRRSAVVYPDETGWKIGGMKAWLWTATTLTATVYVIERGRGYPEAVKILGEAFEGVLGADGWGPYRRFTQAERQLCLAHLLRRCRELLQAPPTSDCAAYFTAIKAVLQAALALRDRRDAGTISERGLAISEGRIEARFDRLLDDPDLHDESLRFARHLLRNREAIFTFLDRSDVEATNHLAEQAIRPAVINRKMSGGNRTENGARAQAVLTSVLRTCKLRCVSAMDAFKKLLCMPVPVPILKSR